MVVYAADSTGDGLTDVIVSGSNQDSVPEGVVGAVPAVWVLSGVTTGAAPLTVAALESWGRRRGSGS
ncbi:MAG: hypothetical protein EXR69_16570 [Myxococcales bacterium]|nr:hypothetical protein [Myxococcales bacterium]